MDQTCYPFHLYLYKDYSPSLFCQVRDDCQPALSSTATVTFEVVNEPDPPQMIVISGLGVDRFATGEFRT